MSLNRRQLLRGTVAAGASALSLGVLAAPARGAILRPQAARTSRAGFNVALLDKANQVITNYHTADIQNNVFTKPWAKFETGGWDPLEIKVRTFQGSSEPAFLVCGGNPDKGAVTIHRQSDAAALGWRNDLTIFPHSLEYLPNQDVVIVVGTRGLDDLDKPPAGKRAGGQYELFLAPGKTGAGTLQKVTGIPDADRAFRQAHGVVWDASRKWVWIYGGDKLRPYTVSGYRETTRLHTIPHPSDPKQTLEVRNQVFENGHDLQPDLMEPQYLWATSSDEIIQINKAGGIPTIQWHIPAKSPKSFSRDRSGVGIWTSDSLGNSYGDEFVRFLWDATHQKVEAKSGTATKPILYKARLLDI
ncbi:hypothetical protein [Streptomyces sp. NRRL F-5650]|uniref:hypothetical protein n=1 Tax=Streptomyces sp. NRRL F-5650 TaxID=1463868 RepID=UPI00131CA068|nr:hypothetical protein [Streptomyces sp. NRRL F-5650]